MSVELGRVCSVSNLADAPSKDWEPQVAISGGKPLPSLNKVMDLSPRLKFDSCASQKNIVRSATACAGGRGVR